MGDTFDSCSAVFVLLLGRSPSAIRLRQQWAKLALLQLAVLTLPSEKVARNFVYESLNLPILLF